MILREKNNAMIYFILAFSVISRAVCYGNPLIHVDEEFYLFTGGRLLHGDLPYVDIWDRKPFGLFLLYAFFHLFGPFRIWAYQLAATLCVWGTAVLIFRMASSLTSRIGALVAAMLYVTWLNLSGGESGQSPVFYNLLVTLAIFLVSFLCSEQLSTQKIRTTGLSAMLLFGLSMQIKYTTVFEGIFTGMYLIWTSFQHDRSIKNTLTNAILWIGAALLPTIIVILFYSSIGHWHEWLFSNVTSIFKRETRPGAAAYTLFGKFALITAPLIVPFIIRMLLSSIHGEKPSRKEIFFDLWAFAACSGVIIFGGWYNHYALPLYPPLALVSAPLWNGRIGRIWLSGLLAVGIIWAQKKLLHHRISHGDAGTMEIIQKTISSTPGCTFVYIGPVTIYDRVRWCPLTNHPFPGHFHEIAERHATGIDPNRELQHVLQQHPAYIVTMEPAWDAENMSLRAQLYAVIRTDYHEQKRILLEHNEIVIYQINRTAKHMIPPPR